MTIAQRAQILDRLAKIEGTNFTAFCVQLFVKDAAQKTDEQIIETVAGLQDQMKNENQVIKRIMGAQYEFFKNLDLRLLLNAYAEPG
jgi:uncharacterized protein (DUF1778 family)